MAGSATPNALVEGVDSDSITVSAGDTIVAFVGFNSGSTISGVSDAGGAYSTSTEGRIVDTGNSQASQVWRRENSAAGTFTVTVAWTGGTPSDRRLRLIKVSGVSSTPFDVSTGQYQAAAGASADQYTSGAITTTNAADFLIGLTQDSGEVSPGSGTLAAGTGFTIVGTPNRIMAVEARSVAATGSYAGTFTISNGTSQTTHVIAFKEAVGGPPTQTAPTGAATSSTTATGTVTTTGTDGTAYAVVSTSSTPPSVAQIQAGQDSGGSAAAWSGSQTVASAGLLTFNATGLTPSTGYFFHFQHKNAAADDSTVASSSGFTTPSGRTHASADDYVSGWVATPAGPLFSAIDEDLSASDADFVTSPRIGAAADPYRFALSPTMNVGTWTVTVRAQTTSGTGNLLVRFFDAGGAQVGITSTQAIASTLTTYNLPVTISGATAVEAQIEVTT